MNRCLAGTLIVWLVGCGGKQASQPQSDAGQDAAGSLDVSPQPDSGPQTDGDARVDANPGDTPVSPTCPPGQVACAGTCVNPHDVAHCGATAGCGVSGGRVGQVCTATQTCTIPWTFQTQTYAVGTAPYGMALADLDGDGSFDLAVANNGSNDVSVLRGNTDGSFRSGGAIPVGNNLGSVLATHLNKDGVLDLVTTGSRVSVLLGSVGGGFNPAVGYTAGTSPQNAVAVDFNGDGHLDLAVSNASANVSVMLGTGDGSLQAARNFAADSLPAGIGTADFNGDGKLDLAVVHAGPDNVGVYLGDGTGSFALDRTYPTTGPDPSDLEVADLNGDGRPDLVVVSKPVDVAAFIGSGDGTFQVGQRRMVGSNPYQVVVADFDGDSKLDLITSNSGSNSITVVPGVGDGTFLAPRSFNVGPMPWGLAVGDLNGDGQNDIVVANSGSNNVTVMLAGGPECR